MGAQVYIFKAEPLAGWRKAPPREAMNGHGENGTSTQEGRFANASPSVAIMLNGLVYKRDTGWQISGHKLQKALESARGAVEVEHTLINQTSGPEPITIFNADHARSQGVAAWAIATYARVKQLVLACEGYKQCCEVFERDVETAHCENRPLDYRPILDLLSKLDKLSGFLHRWLAPLRLARQAALHPGSESCTSGSGGILVPGGGGKDVEMKQEEHEFEEEWMTWEDDPLSGLSAPEVLGPRPEEDPRYSSRLLYRQARAKGLKALEIGIDLLETTLIGIGFICPHGRGYWSMTHDYWQEAMRDRHSPLLRCMMEVCKDLEEEHHGELDDIDIQIGYWNFRGLGAPMRMMCEYTGVKWENIPYEVRERRPGHWVCHEWDRADKPDLVKDNPFVQLPYVRNKATGEVVTGSNAVYLYLGRLLSLGGSTPQEQLANEQVLFYAYQMWMETFDLVYPYKQNKDAEAFQKSLCNHFKSVVPAHYAKLESWLKLIGSNYFVTRVSPCAADFNVWEIVDQNEQMAFKHSFRSPVSSFPFLEAFHASLQQESRLQDYFESDSYKLPCHNKMAFFQ